MDGAGTADLVERIEAAIGAAGPQAAGQRLRRATKQGAGEGVVGIAEVLVVEDVEELGPETKPHLLSEVKLPLQRDIGLCSSETAQYIAPEIALLPGGRRTKSRLIEDFSARKLCAMELKRHSWVYVRAGIESDAPSSERSTNKVNGWS